jgi:hypothetical protein
VDLNAIEAAAKLWEVLARRADGDDLEALAVERETLLPHARIAGKRRVLDEHEHATPTPKTTPGPNRRCLHSGTDKRRLKR